MIQTYAYLSSNYLTVEGIHDSVTLAPITDATVTVTLSHLKTGANVTGASWPMALPHVANGTYRGTLTGLTLAKNEKLKAVVNAANGQANRQWVLTVWVREVE